MSINKFTLYAGLSLFSIAVILYVTDSPRGILGEIDLESKRDLSAYAMAKNASTKYFNKDGSLSYTFESAKLSHFRPSNKVEDSYTSVEKPRIVIFQDEAPWQLNAREGYVDYNKVITLTNEVLLEHTDENGHTTRMETPSLTYNPTQKLAHTEEAVTIATPLGTLSAVGMTADITTKNIKLLHKVKGHHKPQTLGQ